MQLRFLSTLSLRRATSSVNTADQEARFLSTLSLRRATDYNKSMLLHLKYFYPRSPCGERRCGGRPQSGWTNISIHALLAESDNTQQRHLPEHPHFYPRSPCGERLFNACRAEPIHAFLSTLSLRRATLSSSFLGIDYYISIHALLAESDSAK